jgi:hypothetical protein
MARPRTAAPATAPAARTAPIERQESTDPTDWADSAEPTDIQLPADSRDVEEPTLAIDAKDPTLPMERKEPSEAIDSAECLDHSDIQDLELMRARVSVPLGADQSHRRAAAARQSRAAYTAST